MKPSELEGKKSQLMSTQGKFGNRPFKCVCITFLGSTLKQWGKATLRIQLQPVYDQGSFNFSTISETESFGTKKLRLHHSLMTLQEILDDNLPTQEFFERDSNNEVVLLLLAASWRRKEDVGNKHLYENTIPNYTLDDFR